MSIIRGLLGGPKSQRFGIGLAAAFGWDGRLLHAASGRPCWRRGGVVSLSKSAKSPKNWAWAGCRLCPWLGIWIPCLKGPPSKGPQPKACFHTRRGQKPEGLGLAGSRLRPWMRVRVVRRAGSALTARGLEPSRQGQAGAVQAGGPARGFQARQKAS